MSENNRELDEISGFVRSIADNTEQISTIEIHAGDIAEQLKRIADALVILASAVSPEWNDNDAKFRVATYD